MSDFDAQSRTVMIAKSKQAKPRHIAMSDEGAAFFAALTAERPRTALIFSRTDGEPWGASHQQRPLIEASARAGLEPPCTFHILRHTYASALAIEGVPMRVIADQLGHADTRVTEKHYAHLHTVLRGRGSAACAAGARLRLRRAAGRLRISCRI